MEESTKKKLEAGLLEIIKKNKFRFVVKIGNRRYFKHRDGRSAILRRDDNGEVKLERLDQ